VTAQASQQPVTAAAPAAPLLEVADVDVVLGRGWRASLVLSGVSLKVWPGEVIGLVGETGSGKTTLARTIVGLARPRRGRVLFNGTEISALRGAARRRERRTGHIQLVFQDPLRSLDPDLTIGDIVGEGLKIRGGLPAAAVDEQVDDALATVGLSAALRHRQPGQVSGGQRQRVSIARALAAGPRLLLCDEPVSALDASNRNYILRLLAGLRDNRGLPIIVISHDLSSLAGIADRVVVLFRGRIVEDGPAGQVFTRPRHPYTALLLASAPRVAKHGARDDREITVRQLRRTSADPKPPSARAACVFAARCPFAAGGCAVQPPLEPVASPAGDRWSVACARRGEWPALARERAAGVAAPLPGPVTTEK
jgi:oligopeptide/dipeptide ABC transporter ATP-binding protein